MTNSISKQSANTPAPEALPKPSAVKPTADPAGRKAKSSKPSSKPARIPKKTLPRTGTKAAKIVGLLQRPGGASLPELRKATGWQAHSVRGFLSGAVKKEMGLRIHSAKRANGERVYRLAAK